MPNAKTELSREDYSDFRDFVNNRVGLHITSTKKEHLEHCLFERMSDLGHSSPRDYLKFIRDIPQSHSEMKELVNLLTVGETYFFRDYNQLNVVKEKILKPLIEKRNITKRRLKIWSAGCASGEEPYSLAMIIKDLIPYLNFWNVDILATDINHHSLEKAKAANYNNWSFRNTSERIRDKYFFAEDRQYRLIDEIKKMVTFNYLNLVDPCYPSYFNNTTDVDLIICRNVAIYFNRKTTRSIVERFYECLNDKGWLVMGASDPYVTDSRFKSKEFSGLYIYYKSVKPAETRFKKPLSQPKKPVKNIEKQTAKLSAIMPLKFERPEDGDQKMWDRKTKSAAYYLSGMEYFHAGEFKKALDEFHLGFKKNKIAAKCAYMIAKIKANGGDLAEAKKWAKKAVALDKLLLEGYFLLSMVYQSLGQDQPAIDSLKKTVYLDRNFAEGYFCLGVIYKKQSKNRLAAKAFHNVKILLKDKPAVKDIPELKGISYSKLLKCAEENLYS